MKTIPKTCNRFATLVGTAGEDWLENRQTAITVRPGRLRRQLSVSCFNSEQQSNYSWHGPTPCPEYAGEVFFECFPDLPLCSISWTLLCSRTTGARRSHKTSEQISPGYSQEEGGGWRSVWVLVGREWQRELLGGCADQGNMRRTGAVGNAQTTSLSPLPPLTEW